MDYANLGQFFLAFIFVIALFLVLAWGLKRLGLEKRFQSSGKGRLRVVESFYLDPKHRLVLIRRDDAREHLVLLGASHDLLIESRDVSPQTGNSDA